MADLLHECNTGELKIDHKTFRETWCARCHRPDCDLAALAKVDPMAKRNATWRDKFFGTPLADLRLPKYAQIARTSFPSLLQKAMKLEISSQRGPSDWSVPEIPVLDGQVVVAGATTTNHVEEAVRKLAHRDEPEQPEPDEPEEPEPEAEEPDEPEPPPPVVERPPVRPAGPVIIPNTRNTPDPGEVMLGGGPPPTTAQVKPPPSANSWAPPAKPKTVVVKTGAKIQFGADGKGKVVDG